MKKYLLIMFGVILFCGVSLCAEAPDTAWTRTFGKMEIGYSVQQTQDGGYIITGDIDSRTSPQGIPLLKTDSLGNKEWYKTYYSAGCGYSVKETQDKGYIATGIISGDVALIKTDSLGNKEWGKIFGGNSSDVGHSVQQTQDGGYIVTGKTESYSAGNQDVWLIKTDSLGNKDWDKTFGGDYNVGKCVQQTQDGGYIIISINTRLIKTDSLGNKEWDKNLGGSRGRHVQQTQDGGYIITGCTRFYGASDVWLIKTDSLGSKEWEKIFGEIYAEEGFCVEQVSDGGYFIVGNKNCRVWAIRTDESGDTLWTKILGNPAGTHFCYSGHQTRDGGYIIVGTTSPTDPPTCERPWLIKLESDVGIEEGKLSLPNEFLLSQNSSNPFAGSTEIKFGLPEDSNVNISIYNLVGEKVTTLIDESKNTGCYTTRWDATDDSGERVATGIYFAKLSAKVDGKTYTKTLKICLMR